MKFSAHTAALALLAAFAAAPAAAAGSGESAQQAKIDVVNDWNYDELYRSGFSAEEFTGADVHDNDGKKIGEVEDLVLTPDGNVTGIIVDTGGFLGLGDTHFVYPFEQATIDGTDSVTVDFDEDQIADYSLFKDVEDQEMPGRKYQISEVIDDYAYLNDRMPYGWVDDVIISREGQVQAIVVSPDARYGYGRYAWPYWGGFDPDASYVMAPYRLDEVTKIEPFDYERMNRFEG